MASVRSSSWSTEASQKKRKKKRKTGREVRRKKGGEERKERRNEGERRAKSRNSVWSPALTLSSAAVAHVPSPIIPSSASESWNCETVRGLLRYPTLPPVLQNRQLRPREEERLEAHKRRNSINGWAQTEFRFLDLTSSLPITPKPCPDPDEWLKSGNDTFKYPHQGGEWGHGNKRNLGSSERTEKFGTTDWEVTLSKSSWSHWTLPWL